MTQPDYTTTLNTGRFLDAQVDSQRDIPVSNECVLEFGAGNGIDRMWGRGALDLAPGIPNILVLLVYVRIKVFQPYCTWFVISCTTQSLKKSTEI